MPDHTLFGILGIERVLLNLWMPPSVRFAAPLATISEECTISPAVAFLAKGGLLACSQNPKNRRVFLKSIWDLKKGYQTTRKLFSDQKKKTFSIKSGVGVCLAETTRLLKPPKKRKKRDFFLFQKRSMSMVHF